MKKMFLGLKSKVRHCEEQHGPLAAVRWQSLSHRPMLVGALGVFHPSMFDVRSGKCSYYQGENVRV